ERGEVDVAVGPAARDALEAHVDVARHHGPLGALVPHVPVLIRGPLAALDAVVAIAATAAIAALAHRLARRRVRRRVARALSSRRTHRADPGSARRPP